MRSMMLGLMFGLSLLLACSAGDGPASGAAGPDAGNASESEQQDPALEESVAEVAGPRAPAADEPARNGLEVEVEEPEPEAPTPCTIAGVMDCAANEYCDFPEMSACGDAGVTGICALRPEGCGHVFKPVCGCDGKNHSNACQAAASGTDVRAAGDCAPDR